MYRFLPSMILLILLQVGFFTHLKGQGCNLETTAVIGFACSAVTTVGYENGIDCYTEIRMLLDAGSFYEWTGNTADGWVVEQITPGELLVTHVNGTFPSGDHTMVDFLYYTPGGAPTQLILLYPDGCVMESCENTHPLPGCGEGCISGTIYRECGEGPLVEQPGLDGFLVELSDDMGNIIAEYTTIADGTYSFCDLPPGNYIVRAAKDPGWTANVPASGQFALELTPGTELFRNFGFCPVCTCDDFEIILQSEPGMGDTAFLFLTVAVDNPYCLERYEITLDSGEIVGLDQLSEDWEAEIINANTATLFQNKSKPCHNCVPYIKIRGRILIDFGIKEKGIKATVRLIGDGNQPPEPICVDSIIIEHPSKYKQFTCCPEGSTLGSELVVNGEFYVVQSPATDYSFLPYPNLPGEIAIVNHVISPFWLQTSKQVGPFDHFLAVNGSTTPGLAVWKQQVTGLMEGENYNFCGFFNNLFRSNQNADDPVIELVIQDDISLFNWSSGLKILPENPDMWENFSLAWTVPALPASSYTLKILSHGTNPFGNDFGVDCISFRECIAPPQDTCCKDLQAFCDDLENNLVFEFDSCKVTMNLNALLPCYTIEWVDWGNGPEFGPWTPSTFPYPMHTFAGNGTYAISYLAIAYDDSNFICIEKVIEDTIVVQCEPCFCNEPDINLNHNGLDYTLRCDKVGPLLQLPCPSGDLILSGFFGCETADGELCGETPVYWTIAGPNNYFDSGSTTNFQALFFGQSLINTPGLYTVTYSTLCLGEVDSCLCVVQWLQQECDTCYCGGFTDIFVRTPQGAMNMALACGDAPLNIPCPNPGTGFHLTGVFGCAGGACPPDHQIDWSLMHQASGTTHSGSFVDNDPFFGIHILPTYISQPGIYTLTMTGYCNGDTCVCEVQFIIDCPDLCPCDIADIIDLSDRVDQGFAVALANKSCNACFSPMAVNDCETVEWYVNAPSGTPIGASVGPATFCYNFPFSGTYTIYMVVTRLKPDGSICEVFTHAKTITVSCLFNPVCDAVFPNPRFGEGAIAGNMNMEGKAPGWIGEGLYPIVLEGVPGSEDAWSILLTGCYFNSDVLTSADPVCLSKTDTGTITLRMRTPTDPIPGADIKVGRKPPGGNNISIVLYNDQKAPPPFPCESTKEGCNTIAVLYDLAPLDSTDWYEVHIPYDLSRWEWTDSCGGLSSGTPVYLSVRMSNMLSSDQGDGVVRDGIILDQICMNGTLVNTSNPIAKGGLQIRPNPTSGMVNVFLPDSAIPGDHLRVLNLTGQVMLQQPLNVGAVIQEVDLARLPSGLYFLEVVHQGKQQPTLKIVKQ